MNATAEATAADPEVSPTGPHARPHLSALHHICTTSGGQARALAVDHGHPNVRL